MTSPTRQRRRPPNGVGLLLLFVVLGGVFGMHALGTHGVAGSHSGGMTHVASTSASTMGEGSPMMRHADLVRPSTDRTAFSASPSAGQPAGDSSTVMLMCVAVLVASVLLLVRRARRVGLVGLLPRGPTAGPRSSTRGRDRDPPSLALLSVRRC
ncbi:DUF6153 family protein [Nocardioides mesophilus]|uniref:Uncharacterized protein n=1 Tax=Nocardioides mesophilus TaxID=433659 RepID=A0A7G9RCW7_9ACTN|nr:DUF6153 family protein [Nocardioides mesophilus]QNN53442.1 hypothetical protein H9L09_03040 [Nocardioides mesophilus]